jgi:phosphoserine phosphatase
VQHESVDAVWARIDRLVCAHPGGVLATDADGTLWAGDVGEDLFHAFVAAGRVEPTAHDALRRAALAHGLSDAGTGAVIARRLYGAYLDGRFPEERVCEMMTWCYAGWQRSELAAFARDIVLSGRLADRLHGEMLDVLARARAAGIPVLVVSASPVAVVAEAAAYAGLEAGQVVAATPRFADDVVEADVERPIPYAAGKVTRLRERLAPGQAIYAAFGDNAFDVPMLGAASVAVAVRPKARLRACADKVPGLVGLSEKPGLP